MKQKFILTKQIEWNDSGINAWCRKKIQKNVKYSEMRNLAREERERLNADCTNCIHMKRGECEYGLEEFSKDYCEQHEYR